MIQQNFLSPIITDNSDTSRFDFHFLDDLLQQECFRIADRRDDLDSLEHNERLQRWLSENDQFLLLGTGGSSLGAQAIYDVAKFSPASSSNRTIKFVDNLDPFPLQELFKNFNENLKTGILCISKSGETLETITQLILIMSEFLGWDSISDDVRKSNISSKIVVITEDKSSSLRDFALGRGILCLDHPKNIGGRFSVLSIVGMLPAIICGMDPYEIRRGATEVLHEKIDAIKGGAAFVVQNVLNGFGNHVSFVYSDKLMAFSAWLSQLYAESSGKNGLGVTPLSARGSVDQHSQLQLYLDGPNDKSFSFFLERQQNALSSNDSILTLPQQEGFIPQKFSYLKGKSLADIFEAQYQATMSTLVEKGRPLRSFVFPEVNSRILGQLFMHFMLEVPCVCNLLGVNPFDQPAVERGKILTKELLSKREG